MSKDYIPAVGDAVHVRMSRSAPYRLEKIAKIYKNGNLVLDGGDCQWRPMGNGAAKAGRDSLWDNSDLLWVTAENEALVERHNGPVRRRSKVRKIVNMLERLDLDCEFDPMLDAIAQLINNATTPSAQLKSEEA